MPTYNPCKTAIRFRESTKFVKAIMGPIGSGKSVACCMQVLGCAHAQMPNAQGIRKSRWAIIRNSYRELQDTTLNTFFDWVPKHLGKFKNMDMKWNYNTKLPDGTTLQMEVLFRALDRPSDVKKLLSLELTGAFINEAREIPKPIFDMLQGRVGRYPSKRDGGATWYGIIMDTNPPDEDHWWYRMFEESDNPDFICFRQPSGLSEDAENIENLPIGYYDRLQQGKDQEWINVYCHGRYGFIQEGRVIVPEYNDHLHCVSDLGLHESTKKLYLGVDFGLTPACVVAQISPIDGQIQCLDEVVTEDMGAVRFGHRVKDLINLHYGKLPIDGYGDPSGDRRAETDEQTPFLVMSAVGVPLSPAPTNDFTLRREAVAKLFTTLTMTGRPQLVISPKCRILRKALAGGYKYRRIQISGTEKYADKPDKNMYSHIAEALQYLCVGMGHGYALIKSKNIHALPPVALDHNYDPLQPHYPRRHRAYN